MSKSNAKEFRGATGKKPIALLRWLNSELRHNEGYLGKPTKASRNRVAKLLTEINETSAMLAASDSEEPHFDFFDFEHKTIGPRVRRIQALLDEYPKWPRVEIAYKEMAAVLSISDATGGGRRSLGEQLTVWDITRLTESGQLERVRQCRCERWYFAQRIDQKACSAVCRHKTYEQTDSFKAKRRTYMRDYYKLKQSGKVK